jgi:hypothetical protein
MSYLTIVPNYYYNSANQIAQSVNPYPLNQIQFSLNNVLTYLRSALTISVNNYQQNYQAPSELA